MKRSQVVERNRREFEPQHPVAALEPGNREQTTMPTILGVTTRKLRFTRACNRENSASNDLEGKICSGHEPYSSLLRVQPGERESNRRSPSKDSGALENSHESMRCVSDRVLRSSQARVSSSTKKDPKLEIYRDRSPGIVASALSSVDESAQDILSPVVRKSTNAEEPQQGLGKGDRGKENRDPHGQVDGPSRRSPLPEWYRRKPLQDITNVLAIGLGDDQQPQPKKKLKKKVGSVLAPSFATLGETQTRRKDSTITQPKCSSVATPNKQFSNLGKNFR